MPRTLGADCCSCSRCSSSLPSSRARPQGSAASVGRAVGMGCSKRSAGNIALGSPEHLGSKEMVVSLEKVPPGLVNLCVR